MQAGISFRVDASGYLDREHNRHIGSVGRGCGGNLAERLALGVEDCSGFRAERCVELR